MSADYLYQTLNQLRVSSLRAVGRNLFFCILLAANRQLIQICNNNEMHSYNIILKEAKICLPLAVVA